MMLARLTSAMLVWASFTYATKGVKQLGIQDLTEINVEYQQQVKVIIGVMSRCPDAFQMESTFDKVLKTRSVRDKVDLELVYIGTPNATDHIGVSCKHGETECSGNIQQLCAQQYVDQTVWWRFVTCQNYYSSRIGSPALATECAKVAGFDWDTSPVSLCASEGGEGEHLLRQSVKRSHQLEIEKSATLLLGDDHRVRCIRDGGVWKNCDEGHTVGELVDSILDTWERDNRFF
ncbi:Gamma interferon inducible lysosomal thiol reductase GILT [Phaffia rhodozyma]|uniref:Gamma interferon inducible lysosomal thiol reductase GILT n=1 Tax=Phaffia rhodozyma TaxID=264483 RepID=A0A0F7SP59_PHARH|nr:Gamma interferon inducible lysosomal thiol reductase GILT [Phaffia rhodozyma]